MVWLYDHPRKSQCFSQYAFHCTIDYEDLRTAIYYFQCGHIKKGNMEQIRRNVDSKEKGLKKDCGCAHTSVYV